MEMGEEEEEDVEDDSEEEDEEVPAETGKKAVIVEDEGGLDFYPRFWEDPPRPLVAADASTEPVTDEPQHFELPALGRCEARRRNMRPLLAQLGFVPPGSQAGQRGGSVSSTARAGSDEKAAALAASAWRQCRLAPGLRVAFESLLASEGLKLGPQESGLFVCLHSYLDVAFMQHSHLNASVVRAVCALHIVDHVLKANREVLENSAAAKRARREGSLVDDGGAAPADQGFCRTRVLVLCPFRSVAHTFVKMLLALLPGQLQVGNQQRFEEEFGPEDDEEPDVNKPADWQHLFGGNSDDRFRVGMALSKKSVKLYAPFDRSDILICSPLGLRQITGAEGDRKRDFDFLSSIEVCLVDRADVLRMQNWEHVQEVLNAVNRKPRSLAGIDISRLRPAFAEGRGHLFRQTAVTAAGQLLDAEAIFKAASLGPHAGVGSNAADATKPLSLAERLLPRSGSKKRRKGATSLLDSGDEEDQDIELPLGLLLKAAPGNGEVPISGTTSLRGMVLLADLPSGEPLQRATSLGIARQFFLHVQCSLLHEHSDKLFQSFENRYWKPVGITLDRLLIVVNSYFNFLRLRRFFREEGTSFCSAFEYSKPKDLSRSRFRFYHGERRVLLVTERFLWYRRYRLRGADYVLFYGPPETPEIYEEVLGGVRTPSQCNSMCLFTRHDAFALERVVGHERATKMLSSPPGKVFVYT